MMLTICGIPPNINYLILKSIIKTECKISDFILGVFEIDADGLKRIRIGVADDKEGNGVIKCLNGYRIFGHVLRVVPIGKTSNTLNNTSYEWRDNLQGSNYDSRAVEPGPNQSAQWTNIQSTEWVGNQQTKASQMQNQSNYEFTQQAPTFYQQHETRPQNKMYRQQEGFSQIRDAQPQSFGSKDRNVPYGRTSNPSNLITPQRNDRARPHVLNMDVSDQLPTRPQVQGGRYPGPDYNPKGAGMKEHFQGPSQYNTMQPIPVQNSSQSNQPHQGHYQEQSYNPRPVWSANEKTYTVSKHAPSQYEKQSYDSHMRQGDKRLVQDLAKGASEWGQDKGRRSPHRDRSLPERRLSSAGHRVSPSGHRILPSGRRISPHRRSSPIGSNIPQSGRRISPSGRRASPSGRRGSPSGRRISPTGRRISPPVRRFSPRREVPQHGRDTSAPARRMISPSGRPMPQPGRGPSPSGRKISPSGRNVPQGGRGIPSAVRGISPSGNTRRVSPPGRAISPRPRRSPHGRKLSPVDRRMLPPNRRPSPNGLSADRRPSPPGHRMSPSDRRISPGHKGQRLSPRRMSPVKPHRDISSGGRVSPNRGPPQRDYARSVDLRGYMQRYPSPHRDNMRPLPDKDVRPAYDSAPQAQSQPLYSGGYPQHSRENVQFSTTAQRPSDQRPVWQDREKPYNTSKPMDDRGIVPRNQKFDPPREIDYQRGLNQPEGKLHSPGRMSRSPNRRDRSPIRDRYRRHSPSPRSPRRSWALEKRQSPDNHGTQLPPVWQPKESPYAMQSRPNDERITDPVWEKPYEEKDSSAVSRKENRRSQDRDLKRRYYGSPPRTRWGPKVALPMEHRDPSLTLLAPEDRFPVQREPKFTPREDFELRQDRRDHRDFAQEHKNENYRQRSGEWKPVLRLGHDALEIGDVFKRAAELAKKTEEHRKKRNEKTSYTEEREPLRDDERESTSTYQHEVLKHNREDHRPIRSKHPYEASASQGHFRDSRNVDLSSNVQYKRDKAIDELSGKLMLKYLPDLTGKNRDDVEQRLKLIIESIILEMFDDKDVSFIEIIIKFEDRHQNRDLERIIQQAMSDVPIESRRLKRSAPDESHVSAKISRDSPSPGVKRDQSLPNANSFFTSNVDVTHLPLMVKAPLIAQLPTLVPIPYIMAQPLPNQVYSDKPEEGHYLFLCKNNFQPFSDVQISLLKNFIFSKIVSASVSGSNWSPDLTLREVQNEMRLEVWTRDEQSKDWLINLDFKDFPYFSVLTYTAEELWYKRAAIWLPGHLKKPILSPLVKLKLQNRYLRGVNIDKWKLVKEIITEKGTRLYIDLPSSCASALEACNMLLSYELQKVHVFLKAVAVDKNAFDAGLEEKSLSVVADYHKQNASMPAISSQDPNIMKFCLLGKTIQLHTGRKIKEALIHNMFKHLCEGGNNKMDFLRYGFTKPGYFCVVPENEETGKWVSSVDLGLVNGQRVTVSGTFCEDTKYFAVSISLPYEKGLNPKKVLQNFKSTNRGEKGLKFLMWKNGHVFPSNQGKRMNYRVNVDIASIETLIKLNFVLDYSVNNRTETVHIKPSDDISSLEEIVNKWKAEAKDSLDVTNMDISDEEDVVCLN